MSNPTKKSPDVDEFITDWFGVDRQKDIRNDKCAMCGRSRKEFAFRNARSEREYEISGMCQHCQDRVFSGE